MSTDPSSDSTLSPTPHDPPRQDSALSNLDFSKLGKGRGERRAAEEQKAERARLAAESTKRLCLDLPSRTHLRFKKACVSTNRKMTTELLAFIQQRIIELEEESVTLEQDAQRKPLIEPVVLRQRGSRDIDEIPVRELMALMQEGGEIVPRVLQELDLPDGDIRVVQRLMTASVLSVTEAVAEIGNLG